MFGEFGSIMKLLGNRDKLQSEAAKLQATLSAQSAEADAGGGLVTVRVSGKLEVLSCRVRPDALSLNDPAALEAMVVAATNAALAKARVLVAAETQAMAQGLGLPESLTKQFSGLLG